MPTTYTSRTVTPADATRWLTENAYTGQRNLRKSHINYLAGEIQKGQFRANTVITFAIVGNKHYLINGYHTLHAIVQSGLSVDLTLEDRPAASTQEVQKLYATYDRGLTRTHGDILAQYRFHERFNLTQKEVEATSAGLGLIYSGFTIKAQDGRTPEAAYLKSPQNRAQLFEAYGEYAFQFFNSIKPTTNLIHRCLMRAAVCSVGLVTCKYAHAQAITFWAGLAQDDGLAAFDPRKVLLNYLYNTPARVTLVNASYSRHVAAAWNAFYKGTELRQLKARRSDLPFMLYGTPFTGEKVLTASDLGL